MDQIVRSIDIGYGNTKFVRSHAHGKVEASMFPSLAPQTGSSSTVGAGLLPRRDTVVIDVGGVFYEVGRDAADALEPSHSQMRDRSYPRSPEYMALLRAALYYMGLERIDLLVLGLPVNTYSEHTAHLTKTVVGKHHIPNVRALSLPGEPATRTVHVNAVKVFPQPLGGFFDHAIRHRIVQDMRAGTNLVIDPGYVTLDWLVTRGTKPIDARCGAHAGGMSAILDSLAGQLKKAHDLPLTNLTRSRIDEAVRTGTKVTLFGKEYDISAFVPSAKAKAREFVSSLAAKVGPGDDIDNIILGGGGAQFFLDAVQDKFPRHKIVVAEDPVYANVRGFQLAGIEMLKLARLGALPTV